MSSNYLDIIRPGINTTFQDKGRDHLYHIGIPFSGAMDNRNYLIAVSYTHLRAHETEADLVCRLLLEKKKQDF